MQLLAPFPLLLAFVFVSIHIYFLFKDSQNK